MDDASRDASAWIASGIGIGIIGIVSAVIGGSVCPVCVVAAPSLIGAGIFRKWARLLQRNASKRGVASRKTERP